MKWCAGSSHFIACALPSLCWNHFTSESCVYHPCAFWLPPCFYKLLVWFRTSGTSKDISWGCPRKASLFSGSPLWFSTKIVCKQERRPFHCPQSSLQDFKITLYLLVSPQGKWTLLICRRNGASKWEWLAWKLVHSAALVNWVELNVPRRNVLLHTWGTAAYNLPQQNITKVTR